MEKNSQIRFKNLKPVFIVGCSRTGSTLLQNLLNRYTIIDILPEVQLLAPRWIHRDFAHMMKPLKNLENMEFVEKIIELMYSGRLFGVFWEKISNRNFDKKYLRRILLKSGENLKDILYAVMKTHANSHGKCVLGAKFPVYICYADKLPEWFENCVIIHTVRDPRAIFASQYYKRRLIKGNWIIKRLTSIVQFVHINIQFFWAFKAHLKFKNKKNYFCCRYEDLVQKPEKTIRNICTFLTIDFDHRMLEPKTVLNTSFTADRKVTSSFQTSSVNAWKKRLPKTVSHLIEIVQHIPIKEFRYSK